MTALTVTASKVAVIEAWETMTLPAAENINAGQYIRLDTNGKFALGNATTSGEVGNGGAIALSPVKAGYAVTGLRRGLLEVGDAVSSLNIGAAVYLNDTDGVLGDAAGTVSTVVGRVYPMWGGAAGTADKVIRIDMSA